MCSMTVTPPISRWSLAAPATVIAWLTPAIAVRPPSMAADTLTGWPAQSSPVGQLVFEDRPPETLAWFSSVLAAEVKQMKPLLGGVGERHVTDDARPRGSGLEQRQVVRPSHDDAGIGGALGRNELDSQVTKRRVRVHDCECRIPHGTSRPGPRSAENTTRARDARASGRMRFACSAIGRVLYQYDSDSSRDGRARCA
jgi:hypothetical protein